MAIITHHSSKNASYADVLEYYTCIHREDLDTGHYEPILDENGLMQERENYSVAYISAQGSEAPPEQWAAACIRTNFAFKKNGSYGDVKSHEYIISHPAEDRPRMTMEDLLAEGKAFVRDNLYGYDALIAVHRDTDNDHIHITINSVRALQRDEEPWMVKDDYGKTKLCEMCAGGKHQDSAGFLRHRNDWLLEYTRQHGLAEKDNNAIADERKSEQRRQKASGTQGQEGKMLTKHERELKEALLEALPRSGSFQELQAHLKEDYGIILKRSSTGKTVSLQHPENVKAVRLRTLGLNTDIFQFPNAQEEHPTPDVQEDLPFSDAAESPSHKLQGEFGKKEFHFEDKAYVQWLRDRRSKNSEKTEELISQAEAVITGKWTFPEKHKSSGKPNRKVNIKKLDSLLQKTEYVERDLQAEAGKLDKFLERWQQYLDPSLSPKEHQRHGSYLRWCGCDPDSVTELEGWVAARQEVDTQLDRLVSIREPLRQKKFSTAKEFFPEEKQYIQWLRSCRLKNAEKAEDTIARSEALIAQKLRSRGEFYSREDFRELEFLIRKTTYVERDLQTEADKLDKILERWQQYLDPTLSQEIRSRHGEFIRRCGCDPDSVLELEYQKVQREILDLQLKHIVSVREALTETAGQWRGLNGEPDSNLNWTVSQERLLKQQLKSVRANRIKLGEIAYNCQRAAKHRVYKEIPLEKAEYFRGQWMAALKEEKDIQQQLKKVKQQKWDARRQDRTASQRAQ